MDFDLHEPPPDHSTLSRTRRLIDVETHQAVFTWVLQRLADAQLVEGHTIGIDATTLEANAAMRTIVRRDTGDAYEAWLTRLAAASGITTPTRAELARFDRKRKKKGSNDDWTHPHDPDAKVSPIGTSCLWSPMTRGDTRTIAPKSRINPRDNANVRCEASRHPTTRSGSCTSTVSFRIYFAWVDTYSGRLIIGCCEHGRSPCGPR